MIHPRGPAIVAVAFQTRGATAGLHDRGNGRAQSAGHLHPGHTVVPANIETNEYPGKAAPTAGADNTVSAKPPIVTIVP
jgi:hypothetical protein